jgi:hypothetical protein
MTRLYADPVEVRTRPEATGPVPEQFLWRGRLYLVREVLARWTATGAWWRDAGAGGSGAADGASDGADLPVPDTEQQWWRVEADSGRLAALSGGRGTYDLCFSWATSTWSVRRVVD